MRHINSATFNRHKTYCATWHIVSFTNSIGIQVVKAVHVESGRVVALKRTWSLPAIALSHANDETRRPPNSEFALQHSVNHRNVVRAYQDIPLVRTPICLHFRAYHGKIMVFTTICPRSCISDRTNRMPDQALMCSMTDMHVSHKAMSPSWATEVGPF
jgi:hypothetical protein